MKSEIQLKKGISLDEFYAQYGSETLCEESIEEFRWPEGFKCPRCSGKRHSLSPLPPTLQVSYRVDNYFDMGGAQKFPLAAS
ncbi:transposase [Geomonas azotofigens]|uniref:transposase n=1 Tax=Geomonas azotofigens TaxID=2843196 RepID=UPI001C1147D4|nr:transposase [Geomonas azotofigens]MBU5612955.1 transposase [Geomonas azotofigens]